MNKAIHGAFRRDLACFVTALSSFQPGDVNRGNQLATAWANFDETAALARDVPGPVLAIIGGVFGRDYRRNIAPTWKS